MYRKRSNRLFRLNVQESSVLGPLYLILLCRGDSHTVFKGLFQDQLDKHSIPVGLDRLRSYVRQLVMNHGRIVIGIFLQKVRQKNKSKIRGIHVSR